MARESRVSLEKRSGHLPTNSTTGCRNVGFAQWATEGQFACKKYGATDNVDFRTKIWQIWLHYGCFCSGLVGVLLACNFRGRKWTLDTFCGWCLRLKPVYMYTLAGQSVALDTKWSCRYDTDCSVRPYWFPSPSPQLFTTWLILVMNFAIQILQEFGLSVSRWNEVESVNGTLPATETEQLGVPFLAIIL